MRDFSDLTLPGVKDVQARIRAIKRRFEGATEENKRTFVNVLDAVTRENTRESEKVSTGNKRGKFSGLPSRVSDTGSTRNRRESAFDLERLIRRKAVAYGVDEDLVRAVIRMESGGNPKAVSSAGAMGLMQLMPETARMLGVTDPFDPSQNVDGGVRYLKMMLERYDGDETLALAAYHSGPGRVDSYGGVPPFPKVTHYVRTVKALLEAARGE